MYNRPLARRRAPVILAAALVVSVWSSVAAPQRPATPVTIRTVPFLSSGVFYVAQAEGFFEAEGLRATFIEMDTASPLVPALIRGDVDVLPTAMSPAFFNAIARGARVRFVGGVSELAQGGCTYAALVANRALARDGVVAPASLRGRRLGAARSIATDYLVETFFEQVGLRSSDLATVDLPAAAELEALRSGRLDAAAIGEPTLTRALASGELVVVKPFEDIAPGFQYSLMVFGPSFLDRQPEVGQRFMRAYLGAVRQFNQGATDRNVEILAAATGLDRSLLKQVCWPYIRRDAGLNAASVRAFQAWAREKGLIDRELPFEQLYDSRFLEGANRALSTSAP